MMISNTTSLSGAGTTVRATANTADTTVIIPAGYAIASCSLINTTANAVTGGVKVGTTSGATDVVTALAVGASALIANTVLSKSIFSATVDQTLFIQSVVAWNSAVVNISFLIYRVIP